MSTNTLPSGTSASNKWATWTASADLPTPPMPPIALTAACPPPLVRILFSFVICSSRPSKSCKSAGRWSTRRRSPANAFSSAAISPGPTDITTLRSPVITVAPLASRPNCMARSPVKICTYPAATASRMTPSSSAVARRAANASKAALRRSKPVMSSRCRPDRPGYGRPGPARRGCCHRS